MRTLVWSAAFAIFQRGGTSPARVAGGGQARSSTAGGGPVPAWTAQSQAEMSKWESCLLPGKKGVIRHYDVQEVQEDPGTLDTVGG